MSLNLNGVSLADDGPFIAVFGSYIPSATEEKNVIKFTPSLTKYSESAHDLCHMNMLALMFYIIIIFYIT